MINVAKEQERVACNRACAGSKAEWKAWLQEALKGKGGHAWARWRAEGSTPSMPEWMHELRRKTGQEEWPVIEAH